jgi:hypothetical protein
MALPTNIPTGINATTTPGQYWTDEDGVSHYTGDVYHYTDQSGNLVGYTPPQLSTGDDNGQGAGEIQVPARWTRAVLDPNAEDGYTYSPYLDPAQQAQKDMYGGAMNPQDASFFPQLQSIIQQTTGGQYSPEQINAAMKSSSWWGQLGGGSNAYNAAAEVAQKLGADTSWYNQGTSDQYRQAAEANSPEGRARANPNNGGLFGDGGFLGLGSNALPVEIALAMATAGASSLGGGVGSETSLNTAGNMFDASGNYLGPSDMANYNWGNVDAATNINNYGSQNFTASTLPDGYTSPNYTPDASGINAGADYNNGSMYEGGTGQGTGLGSSQPFNNSIYQPAMQALMDAGVPWQVVQAMPSVVNSSLQGGALSSLTGGSFAKGAGMGAIGSVLGNFLQSQGFNVPTSLLSLATNAIGSGLGLLGGGSSASGGQTGTNGTYGTPSGNTAGNAAGTTINQQGSGVLPFAPPTNVVAAGKQVTPPPEFGGISAQLANIAPYQSRPMSPLEDYKDTPFQEYAPIEQTANTAAHGGLMHFAEGGDVDKSIAELNARIAKILAPETKEVSQDDQIKDYLSRQALAASKQEFISPLSAKMMRGRGVKASSFSGLPQESSASPIPRMAATLTGMNPLQNTASFIPQARIPFAAHGGQIHPDLARVLEGRNVEMEGEYVPGPEGRLYAKHDIRGFAVGGAGTGQSDDIPTMLSDSEYVIDADTVAALGDGSSKAGAEALDKMRMAIRKHKRSASISDIPPKAKSPFKYIEDGRKMNVKTK